MLFTASQTQSPRAASSSLKGRKNNLGVKNGMKNYQKVIILGFLILGFVLVSACTVNVNPSPSQVTTVASTPVTTQPLTPIPTSIPTEIQNITLTEIPTITTLPTIAASVSINSTGQSSWIKYYSSKDKFSIYHPPDWTISEQAASDVECPSSQTGCNTTGLMSTFVGVYSPPSRVSDTTSYIMIFGVYGNINNPSETQISDTSYNDLICARGTGCYDIQKDNTYYLLNGKPARYSSYKINLFGKPFDAEEWIISNRNSYYVELYRNMVDINDPVTKSTAEDIMETIQVGV